MFAAQSIKISVVCGAAPRAVDRLSNRFRPKSHAGSKFIRHPNAEPGRIAAPRGSGERCSRPGPAAEYGTVPARGSP